MVSAKQSSKYGKAFMLLIGLQACMASTCIAQKAELTAGVAKVDITPADLTGPVGMSHWQGVHDHLYARGIVLTSGGTTAAIVALDLVDMGNKETSSCPNTADSLNHKSGGQIRGMRCPLMESRPWGWNAP